MVITNYAGEKCPRKRSKKGKLKENGEPESEDELPVESSNK